VTHAENIHSALASGEERFDRRFDAFVGKIAQERITRAHWQKAKLDVFGRPFAGEDAVDDFVGGAVAPTARKRR